MKRTMIFALAAMVLMMCSCGNDPKQPKVETDYLPKVVESCVKHSLADIKTTLNNEKFTLVDEESDNYLFEKAYDGKDAKNGSWEIAFYIDNNEASQIWSAQAIDNRAEVNSIFESWGAYMSTIHPSYTIWIGIITDGRQQMVYTDGAFINTLTNMLQVALSTGKITQEEYDLGLGQFGKRRQDYLNDIKTFDFTKSSVGCTESFATLNAMAHTGKISGYAYGDLNDYYEGVKESDAYNFVSYSAFDGDLEDMEGFEGIEDLLDILEQIGL